MDSLELAHRQAKAEYSKQWRANNADKIKAYNARHYVRIRKRRLMREQRRICPEIVAAAQKRWTAKNPDYFKNRYQRERHKWMVGGEYYKKYRQ